MDYQQAELHASGRTKLVCGLILLLMLSFSMASVTSYDIYVFIYGTLRFYDLIFCGPIY